jgi:exonuclease SbcC
MRLETLSLRGILRFADMITLDFKDLPPGLIAVVGPNGAGKTTLMESPLACLYRQFPSRNREVFDYATRTDSFIETTFSLEGRGVYRARLNLDGPHRKAEATIAEMSAAGNRFLLLNDGKVSTYDAEILRLLPPFTDLLASVFAAQNRAGAFSGLDKKGRRELFASLLGLDHYEEMAVRARGAADRLQREIDTLAARRDGIARDIGTDPEAALDADAQRLQVDLGSVEVTREELSRKITIAERALSGLQTEVARHAAAVALADRLDAELLAGKAGAQTLRVGMAQAERDAEAERGRLTAAHDKEVARIDAESRQTKGLEDEQIKIRGSRDLIIADAEKRITANKGLIENADAIRAAAKQVTGLEDLLATNRREQDALRERIDVAVTAHSALQRDQQAAERRRQDLAAAREDAALLKTVPFGDDCAPCRFMTKATEAAQTIPGLASADEDAAAIEVKVNASLAAYLDLKSKLAELVKEAAGLEEARRAAQATAKTLPNLTEAEARIKELRKVIADAQAQAQEALAAAEVREQDRQARLITERATRRRDHEESLAALDARLDIRRQQFEAQVQQAVTARVRLEEDRATAQAEIGATHDAAERAAQETAKLTTYRAEWDDTTRRLATVQANVSELERRRTVLLARRADLDGVESRIDGLQTDLIEWSVLAKAFNRDGLPTIEIDQAGPTVSSYANDLLQACFGGRFTLDLVTQAPKTTRGKDGSTHKEVFEADVYDQQRGGEKRALEDLSGGERVIVEEVLRSAIALLVNQKNQFPLRTLWRDETTGALDPENAERYVAMLRRLQAIGGYDKVIFVTHSADCARLADAQIRVDGGGFSIALPPFVDEAVLA